MKKVQDKPMTNENIPNSNIEYKNDSQRLKDELEHLKTVNPTLHSIILDCGDFCQTRFSQNAVLTMIYRTDQEQDDIYKDDPKYKLKKFKSPHQFYHAFDLRSRTLTQSQIDLLVDYLNEKYNKDNYYKWTAKCHDVGLGDHFHVQFTKK